MALNSWLVRMHNIQGQSGPCSAPLVIMTQPLRSTGRWRWARSTWSSNGHGRHLKKHSTHLPLVSESLGAWWRVHRPRFERIQIIGEQWDTRSYELCDLGTRNGVPFGFYPADSVAGRRLLKQLNLNSSSLPVVIVDGRVLIDPSTVEIANVLGATTKPPTDLCDVAIIGAGPAGLAVALAAASEGLRTVVIQPEALGGQAGTSSMIRNYLGFPRGISGEEIASRAHEQALHFGA